MIIKRQKVSKTYAMTISHQSICALHVVTNKIKHKFTMCSDPHVLTKKTNAEMVMLSQGQRTHNQPTSMRNPITVILLNISSHIPLLCLLPHTPPQLNHATTTRVENQHSPQRCRLHYWATPIPFHLPQCRHLCCGWRDRLLPRPPLWQTTPQPTLSNSYWSCDTAGWRHTWL